MRIPDVKNRKFNKVLCLVLLGMAVLLLIVGGVFYLAGRNPALAKTVWIIAAIFGAYGLIYALKWFKYRQIDQ